MNKNILIRNINLVDVIGEKIIPNTDILVVEGKITKIERNILAKDAKIYDFKGEYICPGLINMHGITIPGKKLTGKQIARALRFFASHNIISKVSGSYDEGNVSFYILPSIIYALDNNKIVAMSEALDALNSGDLSDTKLGNASQEGDSYEDTNENKDN